MAMKDTDNRKRTEPSGSRTVPSTLKRVSDGAFLWDDEENASWVDTQDESRSAVRSVNNPDMSLVASLIALTANVLALAYILFHARRLHVDPWTHKVFAGPRDYEQAMAQAEWGGEKKIRVKQPNHNPQTYERTASLIIGSESLQSSNRRCGSHQAIP